MSMDSEMVLVSLKELSHLREDAAFLQKLRAAGVDNWEGYSEALGDEDETYEEIYGP